MGKMTHMCWLLVLILQTRSIAGVPQNFEDSPFPDAPMENAFTETQKEPMSLEYLGNYDQTNFYYSASAANLSEAAQNCYNFGHELAIFPSNAALQFVIERKPWNYYTWTGGLLKLVPSAAQWIENNVTLENSLKFDATRKTALIVHYPYTSLYIAEGWHQFPFLCSTGTRMRTDSKDIYNFGISEFRTNGSTLKNSDPISYLGTFDGKKFFVGNTKESQPGANTKCKENGYELVRLSAQPEADFITSLSPYPFCWTSAKPKNGPQFAEWFTDEPLSGDIGVNANQRGLVLSPQGLATVSYNWPLCYYCMVDRINYVN